MDQKMWPDEGSEIYLWDILYCNPDFLEETLCNASMGWTDGQVTHSAWSV